VLCALGDCVGKRDFHWKIRQKRKDGRRDGGAERRDCVADCARFVRDFGAVQARFERAFGAVFLALAA
jgi:hypothetical protein